MLQIVPAASGLPPVARATAQPSDSVATARHVALVSRDQDAPLAAPLPPTTDLNIAPLNWLNRFSLDGQTPVPDELLFAHLGGPPLPQPSPSGIPAAPKATLFGEFLGTVDVVSDASTVKSLLKMSLGPSRDPVSVGVTRVQSTLVLESFNPLSEPLGFPLPGAAAAVGGGGSKNGVHVSDQQSSGLGALLPPLLPLLPDLGGPSFDTSKSRRFGAQLALPGPHEDKSSKSAHAGWLVASPRPDSDDEEGEEEGEEMAPPVALSAVLGASGAVGMPSSSSLTSLDSEGALALSQLPLVSLLGSARAAKTAPLRRRELTSKFLYRSALPPELAVADQPGLGDGGKEVFQEEDDDGGVEEEGDGREGEAPVVGSAEEEAPSPPDSVPSSSRQPFAPSAEPGFRHLSYWDLQGTSMVLGSDLLAWKVPGTPDAGSKAGAGSAAASTTPVPAPPTKLAPIHLTEEGQPLSAVEALDLYLDTKLAGLQHVGICTHTGGKVTGYNVLPAAEVVRLCEPPLGVANMEQNAAVLLRFLRSVCADDGHSYWLYRPAGETVLRVFDLTRASFFNAAASGATGSTAGSTTAVRGGSSGGATGGEGAASGSRGGGRVRAPSSASGSSPTAGSASGVRPVSPSSNSSPSSSLPDSSAYAVAFSLRWKLRTARVTHEAAAQVGRRLQELLASVPEGAPVSAEEKDGEGSKGKRKSGSSSSKAKRKGGRGGAKGGDGDDTPPAKDPSLLLHGACHLYDLRYSLLKQCEELIEEALGVLQQAEAAGLAVTPLLAQGWSAPWTARSPAPAPASPPPGLGFPSAPPVFDEAWDGPAASPPYHALRARLHAEMAAVLLDGTQFESAHFGVASTRAAAAAAGEVSAAAVEAATAGLSLPAAALPVVGSEGGASKRKALVGDGEGDGAATAAVKTSGRRGLLLQQQRRSDGDISGGGGTSSESEGGGGGGDKDARDAAAAAADGLLRPYRTVGQHLVAAIQLNEDRLLALVTAAATTTASGGTSAPAPAPAAATSSSSGPRPPPLHTQSTAASTSSSSLLNLSPSASEAAVAGARQVLSLCSQVCNVAVTAVKAVLGPRVGSLTALPAVTATRVSAVLSDAVTVLMQHGVPAAAVIHRLATNPAAAEADAAASASPSADPAVREVDSAVLRTLRALDPAHTASLFALCGELLRRSSEPLRAKLLPCVRLAWRALQGSPSSLRLLESLALALPASVTTAPRLTQVVNPATGVVETVEVPPPSSEGEAPSSPTASPSSSSSGGGAASSASVAATAVSLSVVVLELARTLAKDITGATACSTPTDTSGAPSGGKTKAATAASAAEADSACGPEAGLFVTVCRRLAESLNALGETHMAASGTAQPGSGGGASPPPGPPAAIACFSRAVDMFDACGDVLNGVVTRLNVTHVLRLLGSAAVSAAAAAPAAACAVSGATSSGDGAGSITLLVRVPSELELAAHLSPSVCAMLQKAVSVARSAVTVAAAQVGSEDDTLALAQGALAQTCIVAAAGYSRLFAAAGGSYRHGTTCDNYAAGAAFTLTTGTPAVPVPVEARDDVMALLHEASRLYLALADGKAGKASGSSPAALAAAAEAKRMASKAAAARYQGGLHARRLAALLQEEAAAASKTTPTGSDTNPFVSAARSLFATAVVELGAAGSLWERACGAAVGTLPPSSSGSTAVTPLIEDCLLACEALALAATTSGEAGEPPLQQLTRLVRPLCKPLRHLQRLVTAAHAQAAFATRANELVTELRKSCSVVVTAGYKAAAAGGGSGGAPPPEVWKRGLAAILGVTKAAASAPPSAATTLNDTIALLQDLDSILLPA